MSALQSSSKPVSQWSDDEIQTALVSLGGVQVPVTPTTRPMLERRVDKLLFKKHQEPVQVSGSEGGGKNRDRAECCLGSSPEGLVNSPNVSAKEKESQQAGFEGYYGVIVNGEGTATAGGQPLSPFYTTKSEALRAIRSVPGARFKKFSSQASAEAFSNSPGSSTPNSVGKLSDAVEQASTISVSDKANQFPSLKTQDLSKFMGIVEGGDVSTFVQAVWSNPRYLVNCSGDAPEILQAGFRYNALHCAVRAGQLEICKELMSVLENPDFWRVVYPHDSPDSVLRRRTHLLDLYLNMQDRSVGETPLHFACKLGHLEIVGFLLSFSSLDTTITNKYNETAADIVCRNAKLSSATLRDRMTELMNAPPIYYVPVLRAVDNCTPPQLTPPCTAAEYHLHVDQKALTDDRGTPMIGQAFAGPMSPAQAGEFYREWRLPSNSQDWREALQIKRADSTRGFERVGRQLARQRDVGWHEFWEFLGCYCDLRRADGLEKLEHYLASLTTPSRPRQKSAGQRGNLTSPVDKIGTNENANISRELFPRDEGEETQNIGDREIGGEGEGGVNMDGVEAGGELNVRECGHTKMEKRRVNGEKEYRSSDSESDLGFVLKAMSSLTVSGGRGGGRKGGREGEGREEGGSSGGGDYEGRSGGEGGGGGVGGGGGGSRQENETTSRTLKPMETELQYSSVQGDSDDRLMDSELTTENGSENRGGGGVRRRNVFILGHEPSKVDHDVYIAVASAPDVSATHYPHVVDWMDRVKGFSELEQKSWRTPRSSWNHHSDSGGGRGDTPARTLVTPLLINSPPRSPLPLPPSLPSPLSSPHRLHTSTLSPHRHFSPLHRSLNASSTPSRLHHVTARPRRVLHNATTTDLALQM